MNASTPNDPEKKAERIAALDAARGVATFGIVWTHVAEGQNLSDGWSALGRFGTSFYVIVAAFFVVSSAVTNPNRSFSFEIRSRMKRLLRPFATWSLIYGTLYSIRASSEGHGWEAVSRWWGPLAGTAVHLWFLPFIFVWGLLAVAAIKKLLSLSSRTLTTATLVVAALLYWYCYRKLFLSLDRPWLWEWHLHRLDRWVVEVPPFVAAVLGAAAFARTKPQTKAWLATRAPLVAFLGFTGFFTVQLLYAINVDVIFDKTLSTGRFMANAAGFLVLVLFLAMKRSGAVNRLAAIGKYTYAAFLSHMLFIELTRHSVKGFSGYGSVGFALFSTVCVFAASVGFSLFIHKTPALRFLRP